MTFSAKNRFATILTLPSSLLTNALDIRSESMIFRFSTFATVVCLSQLFLRAASQDIPAPIVFQPSQQWEGNDGPWGTFHLRIGTPAQIVRVLPGTSLGETWVVDPEGCVGAFNCSHDDRGGIFRSHNSSTYNLSGLHPLAAVPTELLGYQGTGLYGMDTVGLDLSTGTTTMDNQVVVSIATVDFDLGFLGLSTRSSTFSIGGDKHSSFFETLESSTRIAGRTWSYHAGAFNRNDSIPASLIFGGYDASRIQKTSTMSTAMSATPNDELVIQLYEINYVDKSHGDQLLLNTSISALVSSMVPHMWLPLEVCQAFEKAFGLEWDSSSQLYLVNQTLHESLLSRVIAIQMTIGDSLSQVTIEFPYEMFDLTLGPPYVNGSSSYFPLRRAANQSQVTLGRVFLQQVYLIADYDRRTFNISQAVYSKDAEQRIFAIAPPSLTNATAPNVMEGSLKKTGLSNGSIAGIAVGASCAIFAIIYLPLAWYMNIAPFKRKGGSKSTNGSSSSSSSASKPELGGGGKRFVELNAGENEKLELGVIPEGELEGSPVPPLELAGIIPRYELRDE